MSRRWCDWVPTEASWGPCGTLHGKKAKATIPPRAQSNGTVRPGRRSRRGGRDRACTGYGEDGGWGGGASLGFGERLPSVVPAEREANSDLEEGCVFDDGDWTVIW